MYKRLVERFQVTAKAIICRGDTLEKSVRIRIGGGPEGHLAAVFLIYYP